MTKKEEVLTPANQDVSPEVLSLGEERDCQQCVKIKAFHQQPEETGHNTVLEEHNHHFAANLEVDTGHKVMSDLLSGVTENRDKM